MIQGIVYDLQDIAASDLAHIFWTISGMRDGILDGCDITYSGNTMYIAAGYFSPRGYLCRLTGTTPVSLPSVSSTNLYCNLVYQIDLAQTASEDSFTQGSFVVLTSASGYPTPRQDDLDNGGTIYQMSFAKFVMTSNGVTNFVYNGDVFTTWVEADLPASGWSSTWPYQQSVAMNTATAAAQPVWDVTGYDDLASEAEAQNYDANASYLRKIVTTSTGITAYCYSGKPSVDLKVKLKGL